MAKKVGRPPGLLPKESPEVSPPMAPERYNRPGQTGPLKTSLFYLSDKHQVGGLWDDGAVWSNPPPVNCRSTISFREISKDIGVPKEANSEAVKEALQRHLEREGSLQKVAEEIRQVVNSQALEKMEEIMSEGGPAQEIIPCVTRHCDADEHENCAGFYEKMREKTGNIVSVNCICDCHEKRELVQNAFLGKLGEYEKYDVTNPMPLRELEKLLAKLGFRACIASKRVGVNRPGEVRVAVDLRIEYVEKSWADMDKHLD